MAKSRPSVQKRKLQAKKIEKAQMKAARKAAREAELAERAQEVAHLDDPDLAGIVAGPQPNPYEDEEEIDLDSLLPS